MRGLPITVSCECGNAARVPYGDRWTCAQCGKTWDTGQIPREEYEEIARSVRRYRLMALGPPVAFAVVLVPLTIFVGLQYAFLLFLLMIAWALLVLPQLRSRKTAQVLRHASTWELTPE